MDHLKNPFARSLQTFSDTNTEANIQLTGRKLPCSILSVQGQLVTVKFEVKSPYTIPNVQMPIVGWDYMHVPVQVGDKGYAATADAYMGGMSGLGGGQADLTQRANLSTLIFHPVSNKSWTVGDSNATTIRGVGSSGVVLKSGDGNCTLTLTTSGIVVTIGGETFTFSATGLTLATGDVSLNDSGITLKTHLTSAVQAGGSVSGPPVP